MAYKVGLGVMVTGVMLLMSREILGDIAYSAISGVLELLGAPEERDFLPTNKPEAGQQILAGLGIIILVVGACIFFLRVLLGLMGATSKPELTDQLRPVDKAGLGIAGLGLLILVSAVLPQVLLYEIFDYDYGELLLLEIVSYVSIPILFLGLLILIPGAVRLIKHLFGWADRVGWGKLHCGWINKLGLVSIVIGVIASMVGASKAGAVLSGSGTAVMVLGLVSYLFEGENP